MQTKIINEADLNINEICNYIKQQGVVVAIPTDTVFGLVCNAFDNQAIEKIYKIKQRKKNKPLGIFLKDVNSVKQYLKEIPDLYCELMQKYNKSLITVIMDDKYDVFKFVTNNSHTIGIRLCQDTNIQQILSKITFPLAQTSCNLSNENVYTDVNDILNKISEVDIVIKPSKNHFFVNKESTIVDLSKNQKIIVRKGAIKEIFI